MELAFAKVEDVRKKILLKMADALDAKQLQESQLSEIAGFVLRGTESLTTEEQLLSFLQQLSEKWPVFADLYTVESGQKIEEHHQAVVENALQLTKDGQIDQALQMVKTVEEN